MAPCQKPGRERYAPGRPMMSERSTVVSKNIVAVCVDANAGDSHCLSASTISPSFTATSTSNPSPSAADDRAVARARSTILIPVHHRGRGRARSRRRSLLRRKWASARRASSRSSQPIWYNAANRSTVRPRPGNGSDRPTTARNRPMLIRRAPRSCRRTHRSLGQSNVHWSPRSCPVPQDIGNPRSQGATSPGRRPCRHRLSQSRSCRRP